MATYSDTYALAAYNLIMLANKFCTRLQLGMWDCCLDTELKIAWTQLEVLPGTTFTSNYTTVPIEEYDYAAGYVTMGQLPVYIQFRRDGVPITVGEDGDSYALTFTAVNEFDEIVDMTITERTKYGFVAQCLDSGTITFEWSVLKTG